MGRQVDRDACLTLSDTVRVVDRRGILFGDCEQDLECRGQFRPLVGRETQKSREHTCEVRVMRFGMVERGWDACASLLSLM